MRPALIALRGLLFVLNDTQLIPPPFIQASLSPNVDSGKRVE
jgi:hypothetical protein